MSHRPAADPSPLGVIAREFPGWQVSVEPHGVSAYWQNDDGSSRRVIVERSADELLRALRSAGHSPA